MLSWIDSTNCRDVANSQREMETRDTMSSTQHICCNHTNLQDDILLRNQHYSDVPYWSSQHQDILPDIASCKRLFHGVPHRTRAQRLFPQSEQHMCSTNAAVVPVWLGGWILLLIGIQKGSCWYSNNFPTFFVQGTILRRLCKLRCQALIFLVLLEATNVQQDWYRSSWGAKWWNAVASVASFFNILGVTQKILFRLVD